MDHPSSTTTRVWWLLILPGALEFAAGDSMEARYKSVAAMTFLDKDSQPRQFTSRTIQTWYLRF
jgi:hypothetical protein